MAIQLNCFGQQLTFSNPFEDDKVLLFKDSNDFIITKNEKVFLHQTQKNVNTPIIFNVDSILKVSYHKIYGNNFDSAWRFRLRTDKKNPEMAIYSFHSCDSVKYFFCRFFTVSLDTIYKNQFVRSPCIMVLKTNANYELKTVFFTTKPNIKGMLCINPVLNTDICFNTDSTILLPLYHPGYTSIKNGKFLNTNIDECVGEFLLHRGGIVLLRTYQINQPFNTSKLLNGDKSIDYVFKGEDKLFAYDKRIPNIYNITNQSNINLFSKERDSTAVLKMIESDNYETLKSCILDSNIYMVSRSSDTYCFLKYELQNQTIQQKTMDLPKGTIPILLDHSCYAYGLITNETIKYFVYVFK